MNIRGLLVVLTYCLVLLVSVSSAGPGDHQIDTGDPDWSVTTPRGELVDIDFETSEATHSSVDISPDGRWVVFDLLGHIYRVPTSGGDAEVLTQDSGISINFHPRYSPDGERIAFISDRSGQNNLWTMDGDGKNTLAIFLDPTTTLTSPQWSPDGSAIYAVREFPTYSMHRRSARIWRFPVTNLDEHPTEVVGEPHGVQALWPNAASDGVHLYYMYATFPAHFTGLQNYQHIRRLNLRTDATTTVTNFEGFDPAKRAAPTEIAPEASPDGNWLAFARRIPDTILTYRGHKLRDRTALWLLNLNTGDERILMDPITRDLQDVHGMKAQKILPGYAWAKDSKSIVISEGGRIRRVWIGSGNVETIPFNARVRRLASEQTRATNKLLTGSWPSKVIRWPSITRDESTVVFESAGWIWKKQLPNGRSERLVPSLVGEFQFMPTVSPDGRTVAFVTWDDVELGGLWTVPIAGGRPKKISERASVFAYPFWSRDGSELFALSSHSASSGAFQEGRDTRFQLMRWRGTRKSIALDEIRLSPMSFGPENRLFSLQLHGVGHVETQRRLELGMLLPAESANLISADLSNPDKIAEHMKFPFATAAGPSPDGTWVAFIEGGELYLTPFHRAEARYNHDNPMTWRGREAPYEVTKEDRRESIYKLTTGGTMHVRWIDESRLIYSQGSNIYVYDVDQQSTRAINSEVLLSTPNHRETLAFRNARIITLNDDQVIDNGQLLIQGDEIICVGVCDEVQADRVIDLTGKTVIPGLIDVHAHGFGGVGDGRPVFGKNHSAAMMYLAFGVTTTLDPYVNNEYAFSVAEMINSGRIVGPRVYSTGQVLMPRSPRTGPISYAEAEAEIHRNASMGAISSKIYLSPRRDQRQMYVEASRKFGLSVTNEAADLLSNIASLLDGSTGLEHAMNLVPAFDDVAQFFGQIGAVYSPTLTVSTSPPWVEEYFRSRGELWKQSKQRRFMDWPTLSRSIDYRVEPIESFAFPIYAESVKDIIGAGGYAAIGGHGQHYGQDSHWEVWAYGSALDPMEALKMASMGGAQMLGMENELGSIEVGKLADLVILDGNPLDDIQNTALINSVMRGGILYDDETLSQLWPNQVDQPEPPWVNADVFRDEPRKVGYWD